MLWMACRSQRLHTFGARRRRQQQPSGRLLPALPLVGMARQAAGASRLHRPRSGAWPLCLRLLGHLPPTCCSELTYLVLALPNLGSGFMACTLLQLSQAPASISSNPAGDGPGHSRAFTELGGSSML